MRWGSKTRAFVQRAALVPPHQPAGKRERPVVVQRGSSVRLQFGFTEVIRPPKISGQEQKQFLWASCGHHKPQYRRPLGNTARVQHGSIAIMQPPNCHKYRFAREQETSEPRRDVAEPGKGCSEEWSRCRSTWSAAPQIALRLSPR